MAKKEANLLVTFDPTHQVSALQEITNLAAEVKEKASVIHTEDGVAEIAVKDARKLTKALAKIAQKNIDKFPYTAHWIPIDIWCKADIKEMQKQIGKLGKGIKQTEKWKMDLKVRRVKEKPDEIKLILKLTELVDKPKVDLEKPEKIIKAEILGKRAGLSLLNAEELLNITKLRQK